MIITAEKLKIANQKIIEGKGFTGPIENKRLGIKINVRETLIKKRAELLKKWKNPK